MARVKKSAETSEEFSKSIRKWLGIERATISITKKMVQKVENPIVAAMMDTILRDSEKHKEILGLILEGLEGVTILTREDMGLLSEYIEKHAETEKNHCGNGRANTEERTESHSEVFVELSPGR